MSVVLSKPPDRVRWSKEFYYQMGELGWFDDKRVELIDGEIYEMSPIGSHHAVDVILATEALRGILPEGYFIYPQSPLNAGSRSEPVPDVSVVSGKVQDYAEALPQKPILVVEVSDSSLRLDQTVKAKLYASNQIPEYWILDIKRKRLIVHRNPKVAVDDNETATYLDVTNHSQDSTISPLFAPTQQILIASLLV